MSNSVRPHRRQSTRLPHPWDSPGKNPGVGCHFFLQCKKVKSESEVAQSCPTLSNPMDCSLPGSSVHEIFQARVLEWGAIAFSNSLTVMYKILPQPLLPSTLFILCYQTGLTTDQWRGQIQYTPRTLHSCCKHIESSYPRYLEYFLFSSLLKCYFIRENFSNHLA